jgi:hypothetical protein
MNKQQSLGQFRAVLTALGTMLATWGFSDGHDFAPIIGVVLASFSLTWGLFHHKDPSTPGKLSWSLFRKFINVIGSAAVTYGVMHPDKWGGVATFLAAVGPLLAARFSWIDNSEPKSDDPEDPDFKPPFNLLLLLLALSILLPSCQGLTLRARTPYANGIYKDGQLYIIPKARAINIPILDQK